MIHFAAYASVPESVADPVKYYQNNIVKTLTLLDALNAGGVKHVLFSSSAATFGETKYVPIDEGHPQFPTNPYGQTKLDAEHILHWYDVAFGIKSVSLRYFCAAGADPEGELRRGSHARNPHDSPDPLSPRWDAAPTSKCSARTIPRPTAPASATTSTSPTWARRTFLGLEALKNGAPTTAYNLGNGKGYSVKEVIETGRQVTGKEIIATPAPRRPGDPATLVATSAKIERELGWKPEYGDLPTMMRTAYQWFESHPNGYDDK